MTTIDSGRYDQREQILAADDDTSGTSPATVAVAAGAPAPDLTLPAIGAEPPADEEPTVATAPSLAAALPDAGMFAYVPQGGEAAATGDDASGGPPVTGPAPIPDENGSSVNSVAVSASGDQRIDGILGGNRWSGGSITYTDPNAAGDYQSGYVSDDNENGISAQNEGFSQLSAQEMIAVHFALNAAIYTQPGGSAGFSVEGFTGLDVTYGTSGAGGGTIRVANSSDPSTSYAYGPSNSDRGGDVFIGTSARTPTAGNYAWHTMIHELGHALGLKHGHETGGFGALPDNVNSIEYSIMTYDDYIGQPDGAGATYETWGGAQTFMMLDIAALQYMYGADFTTNSGNTTYTWNQTNGETYVNGTIAIDPGGNRIFATIWDGGGIDTYDLSNYTTNLDIDLGAGDFSVFSTAQLSNLGGGPNNGHARGNIFNALQYQGNNASLIENAIGGTGNDTIEGNQIGNSLTGNNGNDRLYGLGGNDTLLGGAGTDIAYGDTGNDSANGGAGNDTLYGYTGNDTLNGGDDDDRLYGEDNNDNLDGWTGNDTLYGGAGNDTLRGLSGTDYLVGSAGNDSMNGESDNDTLYGGTENDTLLGSTGNDTLYGDDGADSLFGGGDNDSLVGGIGNDSMDGGTENDTLLGGVGDDTLLGGDGNDYVYWEDGADSHDGGAGIDTIRTTIDFGPLATFNLGAGTYSAGIFSETWLNFENYLGTGVGADEVVIGSSAANSLSTGSGNNSIDGAAGNDTLRGGDGNDTLDGDADDDYIAGGNGDDVVYWAGGTDTVDGGAGRDTIRTTTTFGALATFNLGAGTYTASTFIESWTNFEDYLGTGTGDEVVIGSTAVNNLTTGAGDNSIDGVSGDDTVIGGGGNDTLKGGTGDNSISGGDGDDVVYWETGLDTVSGGAGSDTIRTTDNFVSGATFDLGAGTYTYGSFVESWIGFENYEGSGSGIERVIGSSGNNLITTGSGANLMEGGSGLDTLNGGGGNDTLLGGFATDSVNGGTGNDLIRVLDGEFIDNVDGGADIDTLDMSAETTEALTADLGAGTQTGMGGTRALLNVEIVIGTQAADNITGGAGGNSIDGQGGGDVLVAAGTGGADTLQGGTGSDVLYSVGARADVMDGGADAVTDHLVLDRTAAASALVFTVADQTAVTALSTGGSIVNFDTYTIDATDLADRIDISGAGVMRGHVGNDTLAFVTGDNASALYGDAGNDRLTMTLNAAFGSGLAVMSGGDDNDWLSGTATGDFGFELLGGAGADTLLGSIGGDSLVGGAGADSMRGGLGNDTYVVDDAGDLAIEAGTAGTDLVLSALATYTLGSGLENLILTTSGSGALTGNTFANVIVGAAGANSLYGLDGADTLDGGAGTDYLDGGIGADSMLGGTGADTYVVDNAGDTVDETGGSGIDLVLSSIGTYTLAAGVDNLTLTTNLSGVVTGNISANVLVGLAGANTLNGLQGNDTLDGGAGTDSLDGGTGADLMLGGTGADTYVVDNAGDTVDETGGSGIDLVLSSIGTYTLAAAVENLTVTTSASGVITGNTAANLVAGGGGANTVYGLQGNDTLDGGAGTDYLDGGVGADSMLGGTGADTYVVDNAGDLVDETGGSGLDLVMSSLATYALTAGVDNLILTRTAAASGTGNTLANNITGTAFNDTLSGLDGQDTLFGAAGNDTLLGGTGNDVFGFAAGSGEDRIDDFIDGQDRLDVSAFGYHDLAEFSSGGGSIAASGGNTLVTFNAAGDTALLIGIAPAAITTGDFIWAV